MTPWEQNERVERGLVRTFRAKAFDNSRLVLIGNLGVLALAVFMFRAEVPGLGVYWWAAAVLATTLLRVSWHRRAKSADIPDRLFLQRMRVITLVQGLSWALGPALLLPWFRTEEIAVFLAGVAGLSGSALMTISSDSPSFRSLLIGMTAPLPLAILLKSTDQTHVVMAGLVVFGAAAMLFMQHRVRASLVEHLVTVVKLRDSEETQNRLIAELRAAIANVKTLTGLLPICSRCKKVRDDMGYWGSVERYIAEHTHAQFSHGVCPDCFPKMFPGIPVPDFEMEHV